MKKGSFKKSGYKILLSIAVIIGIVVSIVTGGYLYLDKIIIPKIRQCILQV